ncbi:hypothetical protein [Bacillus mycoides]|uniref:Uncharacterized protein n=1 Tax=Bacillus mycoides (strain KBAB4) TaxID=315730 RepID=A9VVM7_BACMK|nr:hypothetical protein [Bacillus mycoides]ABY46842.1 hypothetical protein BcerKBAB4_5348 [Bacillus mycoides KBAB4]
MGNLGETIERLYIDDTIDITWHTFEKHTYFVVQGEDGRVFLRRKGTNRYAYRRPVLMNTIDLLDMIKGDMMGDMPIVESYVIYPKGSDI